MFTIVSINEDSPFWSAMLKRHEDALESYSEMKDTWDYVVLLALDADSNYAGGAVLFLADLAIGPLTSRKKAYLDDLFVVEPLRRQGIGSALLNTALHEAWTRDASCAEWYTNWANIDAINLYASLGCAMLPFYNDHSSPDLGGAYQVIVQNPYGNRLLDREVTNG